MTSANSEEHVGAVQLGALLVALAVVAASGLYRPSDEGTRSSRPTPGTSPPARATLAAAPRATVAVAISARVTSTVAATATVTSATPVVLPGSSERAEVAPADGVVPPEPPFFTFRRPFDDAHDVRPSRYYPYGTTGRGAYLLHHGVDIGNPIGAVVRAVADGVVLYAGGDDRIAWGPETSFYGRLVVIRHAAALDGRALCSLYGHVSRTLVAEGQAVAAGEAVAEVGAEGIALGPHLHLEFRLDPHDYDQTINPELMLVPQAGMGTIVGRVLGAGGEMSADVDVGLYEDAGGEPGEWLSSTTTYPARGVRPSARWGENFLFGDTPAGRYVVALSGRGVRASAPVTVSAGGVWFVTLAPHGSRAEQRTGATAAGADATPSGPQSMGVTGEAPTVTVGSGAASAPAPIGTP